MNILGISAFYHDSSACLVRDGELVAAAQEERFTRIKHDANFPTHAVNYCLSEGGIDASQIDTVAYYDKPLLTFERLLETWFSYAPVGFNAFFKALPVWLHQKLHLPKQIDQGLGNRFKGPILFTRHHESHAASAFYPSPFEEAAILTIDGVGEWSTTTFGHGRGNKFQLFKEIRFPHSLGLLYSAFTYYLGFKVNSGEYKVMGLAPYGIPRYYNRIMNEMIDLKEDGSFFLNMEYFNYCAGLTMTSPAFHHLMEGTPRKPETYITQYHMDAAASIQKACEEVMLKLARHAKQVTGAKNLAMAGGCALNCVANGLIHREKVFDNIFVQPASGDAGGSIGAALFTWHSYLDNPRSPHASDTQKGSYLGPRYVNSEIESTLKKMGAKYTFCPDNELAKRVADFIEKQKVVGFFYGRMEFGPRALGARSIIGDARNSKMQSQMNLKIKFRESFRPFAPSVILEKSGDYFDFNSESPYMLMVAPVLEEKRVPTPEGYKKLFGINKLNEPRSVVPAITHVDYSARLQTLTQERNGMYYDVVKAFHDQTGCPVIINTSFNIRGEPIVCRPEEAYQCFMFTDMDVLVLENYILMKEDQPPLAGAEAYKGKFKLD
ncbi:MAG: carbamoyltransferase [Elusimicrobia bacterium]|nr:carbamoyltransferase [Candidatus Obscuribacterium magneticum]